MDGDGNQIRTLSGNTLPRVRYRLRDISGLARGPLRHISRSGRRFRTLGQDQEAISRVAAGCLAARRSSPISPSRKQKPAPHGAGVISNRFMTTTPDSKLIAILPACPH